MWCYELSGNTGIVFLLVFNPDEAPVLSNCAALERQGSGESGHTLEKLKKVVSIFIYSLDTAEVRRAMSSAAPVANIRPAPTLKELV